MDTVGACAHPTTKFGSLIYIMRHTTTKNRFFRAGKIIFIENLYL